MEKIASGQFDLRAAARSFLRLVGAAKTQTAADALPDRMHDAFAQFGGKALVILSGADLTAREFEDLCGSSEQWKTLMQTPRITQRALPRADHTCSRREWHEQLVRWTSDWVQSF
ncbi:hypothetical protein LP420_19275 [Massilia sp. B-10]|nr:hypothetical protein LP420_19275 [Massilia sp. B-10]